MKFNDLFLKLETLKLLNATTVLLLNKFSGIKLHPSLHNVKSIDVFESSINVIVLLSVVDPSFKFIVVIGVTFWTIHKTSTTAFSS